VHEFRLAQARAEAMLPATSGVSERTSFIERADYTHSGFGRCDRYPFIDWRNIAFTLICVHLFHRRGSLGEHLPDAFDLSADAA
jgi:hypothetical protein